MRVEDLTKFEGECPNIVVFGTYMDIRVPLTKKWKKIINERGDKPNTYHNCLISYISEQIALSGFNMKSIGNLLIKGIVFNQNDYYKYNDVGGFPATINLPSCWACPLINDDYTGLTDEECEEIHKIQDMERLNFETLFRIVRWDYNRCFKDESLDKDLFVEKYGRVMGEHYYNKFVHEFDGNILKMVGYFRGSEKEGQVFCDMITERIEKYEKRMSYDKGKLNN